MRSLRKSRSFRACGAFTTLVAFLIWSTGSGTPLFAQSLELPLGLATGSKEAHITLDGKQWTTLGHSSNPVYEGTVIRTGDGVASALLKDGTQLELQPRSVIEISGSRTAPVVKIAVGQVLFRTPPPSQTVLVTPSVRYRALPSDPVKGPAVTRVGAATPNSFDRMGEVIVNLRGGSRLGMRQGEMLAKPLNDPGLHIIKTGQSVYIPQVGESDPSFTALLAQALPPSGGAPREVSPSVATIPVYDQSGRSLGYCGFDGSFTASPGITRNLTTPVPAGTIPPEATRPDATPIFTVEPTYVGNLFGPTLTEAGPLRCECRRIPVYDQSGKSVGYIAQDGAFVSSPDITPPLTNPPPSVKLPPNAPPSVRPVFTVNAAYAGYLLPDDTLRDNRLTEAVALCGAAPVLALAPGVAGAGIGAIGGGAVGGGLLIGLALLGGGLAAAVSISQNASTSTP
jgi:hypothetical protein